ncbi:hypothetical protein WA026_010725 [Henosepilachna vigintioctopunctata]|uniref:Uncharacterized protein n=1 Tax=Henosepilachna vigintioctopunctata TaxID=420089 RepID=A0AAW1UNN9_9CUCU
MRTVLTKCAKSGKMDPRRKNLFSLNCVDINCQWKNICNLNFDQDDSDIAWSSCSSDIVESSYSPNWFDDNDFIPGTDLEPLVLSNYYDITEVLVQKTPLEVTTVYADPNIVALDHDYCLPKTRISDNLFPRKKGRKTRRYSYLYKNDKTMYTIYIKIVKKETRFSGTVGKNAHSNKISKLPICQEIDEWLNLSTLSDEEVFASSVYQELLAMANSFQIKHSLSQEAPKTVYADPRIVALDHDYCAIPNRKNH